MLKFIWSCGIRYASERDNTWLCAFSRLPFTRLCVSARSATRAEYPESTDYIHTPNSLNSVLVLPLSGAAVFPQCCGNAFGLLRFI